MFTLFTKFCQQKSENNEIFNYGTVYVLKLTHSSNSNANCKLLLIESLRLGKLVISNLVTFSKLVT